jgi:hypothetical protein
MEKGGLSESQKSDIFFMGQLLFNFSSPVKEVSDFCDRKSILGTYLAKNSFPTP